MYKININVSELFLIDPKEKKKITADDENLLLVFYHGRSNSLMNYVDLLEKSSVHKKVVIISEDLDKLKSDFRFLCSTVKAAGGLVMNEKNEILFIFRRGFWDLPKGKMEDGESKKETALREVEEETGVVGIEIVAKIGKTRHFYRSGSGKRRIKKSYWYFMKAKDQKLVPQKEEDIEQAVWMTKNEFVNKKLEMYPSLYRILNYIKD